MRLAGLGFLLAFAGATPADMAAAQAPVSAQPLAAGEVLLEVNALGNVTSRADRAAMTFTIAAEGATEAEARREAEARIRRLTSVLRVAGVAEADIRTQPVSASTDLTAATMDTGPATDAEAYAAELNMRVVRIVRVTERIGLDGLGLLVSEADSLGRLFGPLATRGPDIPTMVAVGVDFALAPR